MCAREIGLPGVQHEVVVVAHQAVGQHLSVEALHSLIDDFKQSIADFVVNEDGVSPVATGRDVVNGAGELDAEGAKAKT